ncbi:MAG TPA: hypothetical protein VGL20_05870 [Candidatus Dormibacteraeota bacterium]
MKGTAGRHPRRDAGVSLAAAGAVSLMVAATATWASTPVRASAVGCTWAPYGDTCMGVSGNGLHVDSVRVSRGKSDRSLICDYSATVTVSGVRQVWRSGAHSGCTPADAWMDIAINRDFADQSQICGRFFEGTAQQGGAVCETIHR